MWIDSSSKWKTPCRLCKVAVRKENFRVKCKKRLAVAELQRILTGDSYKQASRASSGMDLYVLLSR